jgi:hypothetical protein
MHVFRPKGQPKANSVFFTSIRTGKREKFAGHPAQRENRHTAKIFWLAGL